MKNNLLTNALQYAELYGFCVMPIKKDKTPYLDTWKFLQSRKATEEEIKGWWTKWADANIGIVTGKTSGITVVDIDVYKGADPKPFPKTYTVKTGNGGLQFYYKYQEGFTISNNAYPNHPHVDIRGDTGYVVAPPSVTDYIDKNIRKGGKYEIVSNIEFADFPTHLFGETKKKKKLPQLISVDSGTRNSSMASVVGTIIRPLHEDKFLTDGWEAVVAINNTYKPPLATDELRTTFDSIVEAERRRRSKNPDSTIEFITIIDKKGGKTIIQNTENICRVLREHPNFKDRLRYESFKNVIEIRPTKTDTWRQLEDNDAVNLQTGISILFPCFVTVGKEMVYDSIIKVAKENKYDSAIEWITSLKWDGTKRLDSWLHNVYGAPDDVYHRAVGTNWLKGLVKRLVNPGCKFDFVLVLEGPQGVKKSTSLAVLGGEWHTETTMSTDSKDFFMQFQGKSIIEFSEGETLSRTEVKRMKAIITMQYDRFRVPYERATMDFPRRCVFAMTTNQDEYLKDETGNRRWLPIKVLLPQADIEWLTQNRSQLYAEAYHRITTLRETVYEFPEEETQREQNARRITDPNADLIFEWYYTTLTKTQREDGITINQVHKMVLNGGFGGKTMTKWEEMSIGDILKNHLRLSKKQVMRDNVRIVRWFNPAQEVELTEDQEAEKILSGKF